MKSPLSTRDLRCIYTLLNASNDVERHGLQEKLNMEIAMRSASDPDWAELVFRWELPLTTERVITKGKRAGKIVKEHLAPTMNEFQGMETWQKAKLRTVLDFRILAELHKWPHAKLTEARRRAVRITRHSSRSPDELSTDAIGGKMTIDRVVQAEILAGDERKHVARDAVWQKCKNDEGKVVLEVFELEGRPAIK